MLRNLYLTIIGLSMAVFALPQSTVIPLPQKTELLKGTFLFRSDMEIYYNSDELKFAAQYLAQRLSQSVAKDIPVTTKPGKKSRLKLIITQQNDAVAHAEGYELLISIENIAITATTPAGVFYGIQTLLQLLPADVENMDKSGQLTWRLPCQHIVDYPRFGWRGLMLDVSRHFFTVAEVKQYIEQMVRYKFNTLHLHLTDDHGWRVEIKSLPRLTEVGAWRVERHGQFGTREKPRPGEQATYGGYYTQDDIRELVRFAAERHVTIVPEIDVPGHCMAAIAAYPYLSCTGDTSIKVDPGTNFAEWHADGSFTMFVDNTLNPANEEVYVFLEKVFTELAALFPSEYIHVGGDECYKGFWAKDTACQELMRKNNYTRMEQLQGYFMQRVQRILDKLGKKMIGWDEITEDSLSSQAAVMCWRNRDIGYEAARKGYRVVMAPTAFSYLDYYQGDHLVEPPVYAGLRLSKVYSFNPCPYPELENMILGGQGNLWTENVPYLQYAFYMTYPRALAIAENYWTLDTLKDWNSFIHRVEIHFDRFDRAGIAYSKAIFDPMVSSYYEDNQLKVKIEAEAPLLEIHYTIDGTMPTLYAPVYTAPISIPNGQITLRVRAYRDKQPVGNMLIIPINMLKAPPYLR
ncbi:MAG TPA: family 20 glycosylhydrolase [Bacteroidales bacterium]|nr:family 20 glycosylhydrolase [Bacteroidales bacterium]HPO64461.1 family 20 glycosylhydrolase [Bacteroidales bacterium]